MSYKHITFNESEVFVELEKSLNKRAVMDPVSMTQIDVTSFLTEEEKKKLYEKMEIIISRLSVAFQINFEIGSFIVGFIPPWGDLLDALRGIYDLCTAESDLDVLMAYLQLLSALPLLGDPLAKPSLAALKIYKGLRALKKGEKFISFIKSPETRKVLLKIYRLKKVPIKSIYFKARKFALFIVSFIAGIESFKLFIEELYGRYRDSETKKEKDKIFQDLLKQISEKTGHKLSPEDIENIYHNQDQAQQLLDMVDRLEPFIESSDSKVNAAVDAYKTMLLSDAKEAGAPLTSTELTSAGNE